MALYSYVEITKAVLHLAKNQVYCLDFIIKSDHWLRTLIDSGIRDSTKEHECTECNLFLAPKDVLSKGVVNNLEGHVALHGCCL